MVLWCSSLKVRAPLPRLLSWKKGGNKQNESTSSSLSRLNKDLGVGKTIVFDIKISMRKF